MRQEVRPFKLAEIAYVIAGIWILGSAGLFIWTLATTHVGVNLAGRSFATGLAVVASAGVLASLLAQRRLAKLHVTDYRQLIRGPRPADSAERAAWQWARAALICWVVLMVGLLAFGMGLKTIFS